MSFNLASDEIDRLDALYASCLLDTPKEERFDRITRLAAQFFGVPIALVSLVDQHRQWFKSRYGLSATETPGSDAFCAFPVRDRKLLIVEDALLDARFSSNPLVTGGPFIRFYAGQPVFSVDGYALGTLCIIDVRPRSLNETETASLRDFAKLVQEELSKRAVAVRAVARKEALLHSEAQFQATFEQAAGGMAHVGLDGRLMKVNRKFHDIVGYEEAELELLTFQRITHPADLDLDLRLLEETLKGRRTSYLIEKRYVHKDGHDVWVNLTVALLKKSDGSPDYFVSVIEDIQEKKYAQLALERLNDSLEQQVSERTAELVQKQALLDAILDSVEVGVVACDRDENLNLFNRAAARFHGMQASAVGAEGWADAFDLYGPDGMTRLTKNEVPLYRALMGEAIGNNEMTIVPRGCEARSFFASGQRLTGPHGEKLGAVIAMTDVTDLKKSEMQRALNETRLRSITENLPALIGHIDKAGKFLFLNKHALRFYGKTEAELVGKDVREIYSDEEYRAIEPFVRSAMSGTKAAFESHLTINGHGRHFSAVYVPEKPGVPGPEGFFAMAMDITARKNSELQQAESEERLRTITNNLPVLIAYIDHNEIYRFANATYEKWLGLTTAQMIGRSIIDVLGKQVCQENARYFKQNLAGNPTRYQTDLTYGNEIRAVEVVGIPHFKDDIVAGVYVMTTDVSAAKRYAHELQLLARSDALTGLPNRRSFDEKLHEAALHTARSGRALGLIFLDIDFFKSVNDTQGHGGGDDVLREVGHRLRLSVRATDVVCRLAGDEFTIILEGVSNASEIEVIVEKILATIRAPFIANGQVLKVSTSLGATWQVASELNLPMLVKEADQALYKAKEAGRDQYFLER